MTELGWTDYTLPSRGVLYDGKLPGGKVSLREMHAKQVALLQQQGGGLVGKLDAIIDTCCRLPDKTFDKRDMLLTDRFAVLLALRTKSFGPEYDFRWRCRYCGGFTNAHVNIVEELDEKAGDETLAEPFDVELPDGACTVSCRFLRGRDEETIVRNAKRMAMASNDDEDPSYLIRIAMQLVAKDGEPLGNILERQRFVDELTARDLYVIEEATNERETGIRTQLVLTCRSCDADNEMRMPFSGEFFRPRIGSGS